MIRKIIVFGCLGFFCMNPVGADISGNATAAVDEAGYALLDSFVLMFMKSAEECKGGRESFEGAIQGLMAEAKKARSQNQINSLFFSKYRRLLMIVNLLIIEDPEGILKPLVEKEVLEFIEDIEGEKPEMKGEKKSRIGIGSVAGALANEVINLQIYLDSKESREKLVKQLQKKVPLEKK